MRRSGHLLLEVGVRSVPDEEDGNDESRGWVENMVLVGCLHTWHSFAGSPAGS